MHFGPDARATTHVAGSVPPVVVDPVPVPVEPRRRSWSSRSRSASSVESWPAQPVTERHAKAESTRTVFFTSGDLVEEMAERASANGQNRDTLKDRVFAPVNRLSAEQICGRSEAETRVRGRAERPGQRRESEAETRVRGRDESPRQRLVALSCRRTAAPGFAWH